MRGSAVSSARIRISVGPANMSMPIFPYRNRFASATKLLPGPTMSGDALSTFLVPCVAGLWTFAVA